MRISDWSSDVCSSDLLLQAVLVILFDEAHRVGAGVETESGGRVDTADVGKVGTEVVVAQGRVGLFSDLAATAREAGLELSERTPAAGHTGNRNSIHLTASH